MKNIKIAIIAFGCYLSLNADWPYSGSNEHYHTYSNPGYRGPHVYHPAEHGFEDPGSGYTE